MAFSIGISVVIGGISSAINSGNVGEGIANGVADGIFWGGIFAFFTVSVQAIKCAANVIKTSRSNANLIKAGQPNRVFGAEVKKLKKRLIILLKLIMVSFLKALN